MLYQLKISYVYINTSKIDNNIFHAKIVYFKYEILLIVDPRTIS
jgi:hypothetical protein